MNEKTETNGVSKKTQNQEGQIIELGLMAHNAAEIDQQKNGIALIRKRRIIYTPLSMPARSSSEIRNRNDILRRLSGRGLTPRIPIECELRFMYWKISKRLGKQYNCLTERTSAERMFSYDIFKATKLNVLRSLWIGNVNVDMFFIAIKHKNAKGLIVEIDGSIHDREFKMCKDTSKLEYLHSLGFMVQVFENTDVYEKQVLLEKFCNRLPYFERCCSRARKILWRKIYLETIFYHASDSELKELFGYLESELL